MSATYQTRALYGTIDVDSVYLFGRLTKAVLLIEFETETDYVETCLLIKTVSSTLCVSTEKQKDAFAVSIDNRLNVLSNPYDVPQSMYPPISSVQVSDYTVPYAQGSISSKNYTYRIVPTKGYITRVVGSTYQVIEVDTKYVKLEMSSSGTNARYGVKIENIPLFPSFLAFEHVHLAQSSVYSRITVKLYTDLTLY